jgi:hypothetical protein
MPLAVIGGDDSGTMAPTPEKRSADVSTSKPPATGRLQRAVCNVRGSMDVDLIKRSSPQGTLLPWPLPQGEENFLVGFSSRTPSPSMLLLDGGGRLRGAGVERNPPGPLFQRGEKHRRPLTPRLTKGVGGILKATSLEIFTDRLRRGCRGRWVSPVCVQMA